MTASLILPSVGKGKRDKRTRGQRKPRAAGLDDRIVENYEENSWLICLNYVRSWRIYGAMRAIRKVLTYSHLLAYNLYGTPAFV